MNKLSFLMVLGLVVVLQPIHTCAQKDNKLDIAQSSEVFLEEYSDAFQESFFEGLKQKAIQNYDRASLKFLECQKLEPQNDVVSHQLATTYYMERRLVLAQEAALFSVQTNPENFWYASTFVDVLVTSTIVIDQVKSEIPWKNKVLRTHLAKCYYNKRDFNTAKAILKGLPKTEQVLTLENEIDIALSKKRKKTPVVKNKPAVVNESLNNAKTYTVKLNALIIDVSNTTVLFNLAEEAIENYPSQPYFYYALGVSLNRLNKFIDAIEALEFSLDYLVDDVALQNGVYEELSASYIALNKPEKANSYSKKIKP